MALDDDTIESISVGEVKRSILASRFLNQYIKENEKEPSWDGFVCIYKKEGRKKKNLKGRIPVQVKGKENNNLTKKKISYPMDTVDLRNYLNDGGCILFVVYIKSDCSKSKIYYNALTPLKLRQLLDGANKYKSVPLTEFPTDNKAKLNILINFYENCQKQKSYSNCDLLTVEELREQHVLEKLVIPFSTVGDVNPLVEVFNTEVYLYAQVKGNPILQPVDMISNLQIKRVYRGNIKVGDRLFYSEYALTESADEFIYEIGNSFTIKCIKQNKRCEINYSNSKKIRILAKDLDFILACIEKGYFTIEDKICPLNFGDINLDNFNIDSQKEHLKLVQDIVKVLDILNCNDDIDIRDMDNVSWRNIQVLIKALVYKQPVSGLKEDLFPILCVRVGKLRFLIIANKIEDASPGTYEINNFFAIDIPMLCSYEDGERFPVSQYSILQTKDFLSLSNMNFDVLLPSFKNAEHHILTFERANLYLLDMLKAYDMAEGIKKEKLLKACNDFAEWVMQAPDEELHQDIKILNLLQTVKRSRELNRAEIEMLYKIVENRESKEDCIVGAYLLLGQQQAAEIHFSKLPEEEQNNFKSFPIYHFWKPLNNDAV